MEALCMLDNELTKLLQINYPILQAPMAGGITTSKLVAEVSNIGGLGMIGVGGMPANDMYEQIKEVKQLTSKPFGINLFVHPHFSATEREIEETQHLLKPLFEKLGINQDENVELPSIKAETDIFMEKINMIVEEKVPVCSFVFGIPSLDVITRLKDNGITVIGTATTVEEAVETEKAGMDAVVVQGSEAGGHRGTFLRDVNDSLLSTMSLVQQVADQVSIPIIATGGIMDGRGLVASIQHGAQGVQMGTAFITTNESGAHPLHKEAILSSRQPTVLTRSFTGKYARAIKNAFINDLEKHESTFPAFPIHRKLTQPIVSTAKVQKNPDYMLLLSGQNTHLSRRQSARELVESIIEEAKSMQNHKGES